jgi:RNA polymerase sigma-70 factor (ECF subfamily)
MATRGTIQCCTVKSVLSTTATGQRSFRGASYCSPAMVSEGEGERGADTDAVQRMLRGDEDAFRSIYRDVQPGLLRYLTYLVGTADAEDVAAEAWAQAVRDLGSFSGSADGFRGWITTIGRHRAMDLLRTRTRRPVADVEADELLEMPGGSTTEGEAMGLVGTADALELIASLPQDQAEAVLLRAVVGLDAKAAARVLGKRPGAVRTAAYRGLKTLKQRISAGE